MKNSSISLTMVKLTRAIAFKVIFHKNIKENKLVSIMKMVIKTMTADQRSQPSNTNVIMNIARRLMPKLTAVSLLIVRYCS